jgi:hemin uptake protein HemP
MSMTLEKPSLRRSEATEAIYDPPAGETGIASASIATRLAMTRIVRSQDLFQGKREVIIEHAKEYYRLLITKSGKLILNK